MKPDNEMLEESTTVEQQEPVQEQNQVDRVKAKENVKFITPNTTFTSENGGDSITNDEHVKEAKKIATPAIFKRRQATRHLVVQSPTDHIFSPCSQKLLHKKRTEAPKEY